MLSLYSCIITFPYLISFAFSISSLCRTLRLLFANREEKDIIWKNQLDNLMKESGDRLDESIELLYLKKWVKRKKGGCAKYVERKVWSRGDRRKGSQEWWKKGKLN